jgi:anti-anti-sigma factor
MSALELHTRKHEDAYVVDVIGPITRRTSAILRERLRELLTQPGVAEIDLDLRCCTDVDVDGLLALDVARQATHRRGGRLRLVRVPPLIERLIWEHHLTELVSGQCTTTEDRAVGTRPVRAER